MNKLKLKHIILCITYALVLAFLLLNIKTVWSVITNIFSVLSPVLYGFVIAYILSFPYNFFSKRCFHKIGTKRKKLKKINKPLSMLCSYVIVFGIATFLICILIPQVSESVTLLFDNIPSYMNTIQKSLNNLVVFIKTQFGYNLYDADTYNKLMETLTGSNSTVFLKNLLSNIFPAAVDTAKGITTGLYNWIIGIIISIYLLASKDRLCHQARAIVTAYCPKKARLKIFSITDLCNKKCGKYIIGKVIDSLIIGIICFIGLSIFKFDYALLISVVVGVTNIIPFFGPIIGAVPSAFLLLIIDPMQSVWFIVFVIILQQFDGNILGPKILGESVGISGFWILFSVIVGGGLFGLPGMVLGVPVFAVIYTLIDDNVEYRMKKKLSSDNGEDSKMKK